MLIELQNVSYVYSKGSPYEKTALDNINLKINEGEFLAVIGHTGSGKSTLVQHFNGLISPTSGKVLVESEDISNLKNYSSIRQKIGIVFQYAENQLFEDTVYEDIAFGPKNMGYSEVEIERNVKKAMNIVKLDYEKYKDINPYFLSGGEKRRAAVAGVLVMNPKVLVLDEPAAGLDPAGREEILSEIKKFREELNITVIIVSHSMEEVAKLVDRGVVMNDGKIIMDGTPVEIFRREDELINVGLNIPQVTKIMRELKKRGANVDSDAITIEQAKNSIEKYLKEVKNA